MINNLQFCPELIKLLKAGEITGRSGSVQSISSVSTPNNLVVLRNLFLEIKPKRTLEVGFAFGGSAMLFTASHRETGLLAAGQHTAIDPFQTTVWDDAGLIALENAGLREFLDFRPAFSCAVLPQLVADSEQFELIYIDGSHLFEDVFVDFYFSSRLLAEGGIVAFDDSSDPHVQKVLRFIRRNCGSTFEPVDVGPHRSDKGASFRYKVAVALHKQQLTAFRKIGPSIREWNSRLISF